MLFGILTVNAQQNKTYNGVFKLSHPFVQNAKAIYAYYDESGSEVLNGDFKVLFNGNSAYEGFNQNITGKYKDGNKNGLWIHSTSFKDWKIGGSGKSFATGSVKLSANYTNGNLDGNVNYTSSLKGRKKDYYGKFSGFSPTNTITLKASFKNNTAINHFNYRNYNAERNNEIVIDILMDSKGLVKTWKTNNNGSTNTETYINGILKDQNYAENKAKFDKYINLKENNPDSLAKLPYKVDTVSLAYNTLIQDAFKNTFSWMLFLNDLKGDNFYQKTSTKVKYNVSGFYEIQIKPALPKEYETLADSALIMVEIYQELADKNEYAIKHNAPKELQTIKSGFRKQKSKCGSLKLRLKEATNYYSGNLYRKDISLADYEKEKGIEGIEVIKYIYNDLQKIGTRINELEKQKLPAEFNSYIADAKWLKKNTKYDEALKNIEKAIGFADLNPDANFDLTEAEKLKKEIFSIQFFAKTDSMLLETEFLFKLPSETTSAWEQAKLKTYYSNYYTYYTKEATSEYYKKEHFPDVVVNVTKLYDIRDRSANANVWRKDAENIYNSFRVLTTHYQEKVKAAQTNEQLELLKELCNNLEKYPAVINAENRKDIDKQFKKAKDIESIKTLLDQ